VAFDATDAVCFRWRRTIIPARSSRMEAAPPASAGHPRYPGDGAGGQSRLPIRMCFCVAGPEYNEPLPKGVIHPKRVLRQIVAGVRDYGNRMGIPTVNGGGLLDPDYLGNPLVFCGCVGLIPRDKIFKAAHDGNASSSSAGGPGATACMGRRLARRN